jgi:hypothetical protein
MFVCLEVNYNISNEHACMEIDPFNNMGLDNVCTYKRIYANI